MSRQKLGGRIARRVSCVPQSNVTLPIKLIAAGANQFVAYSSAFVGLYPTTPHGQHKFRSHCVDENDAQSATPKRHFKLLVDQSPLAVAAEDQFPCAMQTLFKSPP